MQLTPDARRLLTWLDRLPRTPYDAIRLVEERAPFIRPSGTQLRGIPVRGRWLWLGRDRLFYQTLPTGEAVIMPYAQVTRVITASDVRAAYVEAVRRRRRARRRGRRHRRS